MRHMWAGDSRERGHRTPKIILVSEISYPPELLMHPDGNMNKMLIYILEMKNKPSSVCKSVQVDNYVPCKREYCHHME